MIQELKEDYLSKSRTKEELYHDFYEARKELFDYLWVLEDSICQKIVLSREGVYAEFAFDGYNLKLYCDPDESDISLQLMMRNTYETEELSMVRRVVSFFGDNPVIYDVGANIGYYGLSIKKWKPGSEVFFFEPVPQTYKRLNNNILLNGMNGCHTFNFGLYNRECETEFYYDIVESGASSLSDLLERQTTEKIHVRMRKLDNVVEEESASCPSISTVDFLKCDVEGAELFVYQGGIETIKRNKPVILSEMYRKWEAKQGYHPNDIINLLSQIGYGCYVIDQGGIREIETVTHNKETNYLFFHKQKHSRMVAELLRR